MRDTEKAAPTPAASSTPSVSDLPVSRVVDGWKLYDGSLCLLVRCDDGVTRPVRLPAIADA